MTYKDQFSSNLIHLKILDIVFIHTFILTQRPLVFLILLFSRGLRWLFPDQDYSIWIMTNRIPQLLAKFIKIWCRMQCLRFFSKIPLEDFFYSHQDTTLCKFSEKPYVRFSRYGVAHTRTHVQTHVCTHDPECIGLPA